MTLTTTAAAKAMRKMRLSGAWESAFRDIEDEAVHVWLEQPTTLARLEATILQTVSGVDPAWLAIELRNALLDEAPSVGGRNAANRSDNSDTHSGT